MRHDRNVRLEVCVDSVESAVAAERGGADRIELCADLPSGGTTPSAGLIREVQKRVSIGVHVMIRPRPGDFYYSRAEFETMVGDVEFCKRAKVAGVVFGILKPGRTLDAARMRLLAKRASPLHVTMHRAIDEIRNWRASVDHLAAMGVNRILTSGGAASVERGRARIRTMAAYAAGQVEIVPGGGVTFANAASLISIPHIHSLHVLSAVTERPSTRRAKYYSYAPYTVRAQRVRAFLSVIRNV